MSGSLLWRRPIRGGGNHVVCIALPMCPAAVASLSRLAAGITPHGSTAGCQPNRRAASAGWGRRLVPVHQPAASAERPHHDLPPHAWSPAGHQPGGPGAEEPGLAPGALFQLQRSLGRALRWRHCQAGTGRSRPAPAPTAAPAGPARPRQRIQLSERPGSLAPRTESGARDPYAQCILLV